MKFIFYVIDLEEGTVRGTNDVEEIEEFIDDDFFIILHQNGSYFRGNREEVDVQSLESSDESGEDPDDD